MKKIKIILSLILFLSSLTIIAQRTEDEFLTGDNGFEEIVPPPGTECIECPNIKDFSFVNSFNALDAAFTNQLLLNTARDKKYREWFNKQKNIIKAELEKKFSKTFDSYDAAKTALFLHSEKNNIVVNAVAPRKKYHDLEFSKRRTQNIYLEEISFLKLRNLEIKSGNLDNSKYGYLQVDGVSLKNIKTLEDLNTKWNTLYDRFRTNYRQKFFYDKVHSNLSLGNLITNFSNQALQLKNLYYTNINDEWEQLNYMQFLINYENIKKFLTPPLYYPKLIYLFNKFKGTDQATSPVIENHALSRSSYPSLFRTDYDLTLEIYELLQNPEDLNEATHLKRKEAERLRAEADGLNNLLKLVDQRGIILSALQQEKPDYFGQQVITPTGKPERIHENAIAIADSNGKTFAFITPDEKFFFWVETPSAYGWFLEGDLHTEKRSYMYYVEDKYNRQSQPISWGIHRAADDLGGFILDLVGHPKQTIRDFASGMLKIISLDFDVEKTWNSIINADLSDASYVVATLAMGHLSGPKGKNLIPAAETPQFQELLAQYAAKIRPAKLTWAQVLELFRKARIFENNISQHLKTLYKASDGYSVFNQVYLKIDGVVSIVDDLIYNVNTQKFILNETKYGAHNVLSKNQKVIQDAIKAGKNIEVRSKGSYIDVNGNTITLLNQGNKINISEILRSYSSDGTILNSTVQSLWKK